MKNVQKYFEEFSLSNRGGKQKGMAARVKLGAEDWRENSRKVRGGEESFEPSLTETPPRLQREESL